MENEKSKFPATFLSTVSTAYYHNHGILSLYKKEKRNHIIMIRRRRSVEKWLGNLRRWRGRDGRGYCAEGLWGNGRKVEGRCGSVEERCGMAEGD
ncbi:MAG: hypothetical protein ACI4UC_08525 [Alloprevotella sp.]